MSLFLFVAAYTVSLLTRIVYAASRFRYLLDDLVRFVIVTEKNIS